MIKTYDMQSYIALYFGQYGIGTSVCETCFVLIHSRDRCQLELALPILQLLLQIPINHNTIVYGKELHVRKDAYYMFVI